MNYKKVLTNILIVGANITLLFAFEKNVLAQESAGFAISPPTFEVTANPNDLIKNTIRIDNISDSEISLQMETRNFVAIGEEGSVELTEDNDSFSLSRWIKVPETIVTIAPKKSQIIAFEIQVPSNAEPGGHFGSIVFKTVQKNPENQTGASVQQEIGALILMKIAGKTSEGAIVEKFESTNKFYEYGPVEFDIKVKNQGNIHIKPSGGVTITNFFGQKIANLDLDSKNVLPNATRKMPISWDKKLLIGPYTATLSMTYGSENTLLTSTTSFWTFPYKVGSVVIAVTILILFFLFKMRKRLAKAFKVLVGK